MKLSKFSAAAILFFMLPISIATADEVRFNGSFRNSLYLFDQDQSHVRLYQHLRFKALLPNDNLSLSANLRFLTDTVDLPYGQERFRLYSLRFDAVDLFNKRLDVAVGRMFLHPGTPLGALDGVHASLSARKNLTLQFYGGVQGRFDRGAQVNRFQDYQVLGGAAEWANFLKSKLQVFYLQKSAASQPYWHLAGVNLYSAALPKTILRLQTHYDLEQSRLHRLLFSTRNTWGERLQTTLEYRRQFPQIYADSYFTIFTPVAFQRLRAAAALQLFDDYFLETQYQHLFLEDDQADQIYLTLGNTFGSFGMVWENGYAGDQLGVVLDAYYEVIKNLTASLSVDYTRYRIEQVYEYDQQLANAVRLDYRFNRRLAVAIEYQWLTNRYQASDSRLLNHVTFIW